MLDRIGVMIRRFLRVDEGATGAEYAIMASAIAVVIIVAVFALGLATEDLFQGAGAVLEEMIGS